MTTPIKLINNKGYLDTIKVTALLTKGPPVIVTKPFDYRYKTVEDAETVVADSKQEIQDYLERNGLTATAIRVEGRYTQHTYFTL